MSNLQNSLFYEDNDDKSSTNVKYPGIANKKSQSDKYLLDVTTRKILDGNDFKSGIYKVLETPIELKKILNPSLVKKTLDEEYPWFCNVNDLVYRQLMMQSQSNLPVFKLRPILLAGSPGVGKTSWAIRLAELVQVPFRTVMAAGGQDAVHLRGVSRGWSSAKPGAVVQAIVAEEVANPLFIVDEIDKASTNSSYGRIWDVLLQLIEASTATTFMDECLEVEVNLSYVSWIATCNQVSNLPKPLLDRFTIIVVKPPNESHFNILVNGAIKKIANELGVDQRMLPALDGEDMSVLKRCKSPREINRTIRLMLEKKSIELMNFAKRN